MAWNGYSRSNPALCCHCRHRNAFFTVQVVDDAATSARCHSHLEHLLYAWNLSTHGALRIGFAAGLEDGAPDAQALVGDSFNF